MRTGKSNQRRFKWVALTFALFVAIGLGGRNLFQIEPWQTLWPAMAGLLALAIGLGVEFLVENRRQ